MAWRIEFETKALKELKRLDPQVARRILDYLKKRVATHEDPRTLSSPLSGQWGEYRRFRVGHYRIIAQMEDEEMVILVVRVGHRREVYQ